MAGTSHPKRRKTGEGNQTKFSEGYKIYLIDYNCPDGTNKEYIICMLVVPPRQHSDNWAPLRLLLDRFYILLAHHKRTDTYHLVTI